MSVINQTFQNLEHLKQQRIINAALKEFAEKGYEQASTNQIVKNAGIGKGMLFYYFKNKRELYLYLIDYCLDITLNEYLHLVDTNEMDFIDRMRQASQIKVRSFTEKPNVFYFMGSLLLTNELELPVELEKRMEELQRLGYSKLYDNIDTSLFRDDVDVNKVYKLIRWSIEGYQNELTNRLKSEKLTSIDLDPLWDEFYEYLDILKKSFYK